jgi:hypothetical protein
VLLYKISIEESWVSVVVVVVSLFDESVVVVSLFDESVVVVSLFDESVVVVSLFDESVVVVSLFESLWWCRCLRVCGGVVV